MARTVWEAFNEFEGKIQPTQAQFDSLAPKLRTATSYLSAGFPASSDMPFLRAALIGSTAHGVLIRQLNDIDMMAVFDDTSNIWETNYRNNSQAFLQRIKRAFGTSHIETIGVRGQAVRLFYKQGAHVDIAPVFRWHQGGYILPAGDGSWLRTDPDIQARWFEQRHRHLNNHLIPMIRLVKHWNNAHGRQLKSYHLGVMVGSLFNTINFDRPDALRVFFTHAPNFIDVADPAGHSGTLSSYLTPFARTNLELRLASAAQRADNAVQAAMRGNHQEAIRLWRIELGDEFPTY